MTIAATRLNTVTSGDQTAARVVALPADGGYLLVMSTYDGDRQGIVTQRFDATGQKQGAETFITAAATDDAGRLGAGIPTAVPLPDGRQLVLWNSYTADGYWGVSARLLQADGTLSGAAFSVKPDTSWGYDPQAFAAASLSGGGLVVTWAHDDGRGNSGVTSVDVRLYDAAAQAVGPAIRVRTSGDVAGLDPDRADDSVQSPDVAALPGGGWVLSWIEDDHGVKVQRFGSTGAAAGPVLAIDDNAAGTAHPAVATLRSGDVVVAWGSNARPGDDEGGIYAQRLGADGAVAGAAVHVNTTTAGDQLYPDVAALADGGYVVAWLTPGDSTTWADSTIRSQRYSADGTRVGDEIVLSTQADDRAPSVTALCDGGYLVTWTGSDGAADQNSTGIYAQRFAASGLALADNRADVATPGHDRLSQAARGELIDGLAGIDTVVYCAARASYTLQKTATGHAVASTSQGTDTLSHVERLQFADAHVALDLAPGEAACNTVRVIGAAFGAAAVTAHPDWVGIGLDYFDGGRTMAQVCDLVAGLLQLGNAALVDTLYTHVVHTAPSPAEQAYFVGLLAGSGGSMSQGQLLELAATVSLNDTSIDLTGLAQTGVAFVPV